jgi:hypothetical protein
MENYYLLSSGSSSYVKLYLDGETVLCDYYNRKSELENLKITLNNFNISVDIFYLFKQN